MTTVPVPGGRLTSRQGPRGGRIHMGIDLSAPRGTPVFAVVPGEAVAVDNSYPTWPSPPDVELTNGYGNQVVIRDGGGQYWRYAHLDKVRVAPGDQVAAGREIGTVGSTTGLPNNRWRTMAPHLHLEVLSRFPAAGQDAGARLDVLTALGAAGVGLVPGEDVFAAGEPVEVSEPRWGAMLAEAQAKGARPGPPPGSDTSKASDWAEYFDPAPSLRLDAARPDVGALDVDAIHRILWGVRLVLPELTGPLAVYANQMDRTTAAVWGENWRSLADQTAAGRTAFRRRMSGLTPDALQEWCRSVGAARAIASQVWRDTLDQRLEDAQWIADIWETVSAVASAPYEVFQFLIRSAGEIARGGAEAIGGAVGAFVEGTGIGGGVLIMLLIAAALLMMNR